MSKKIKTTEELLKNQPLSSSIFFDCMKGLIEAIDERTRLERDKFDYQMKRNAEADESKRRMMKTLQVIYDQSKASNTSPGEVLSKIYDRLGIKPNEKVIESLIRKNFEKKKFTAASVRTKGKKIRTR